MNDSLVERTVPGLHAELAQRVLKLAPRTARVLDVGCGTGAWLERLRRLDYVNLSGTDRDTAQFRLESVPVFSNDLNSESWVLPERDYQVITAIEVIEHLQNIDNFLRNICQRLASGGVLVLTTPNVHSLHARLRFFLSGDLKQFGRIGDPTHLLPILTSTLRRLAALHGLEVLDEWGYPQSGDAHGARSWVNLSMRALRMALPEPVGGDVYCALLRKS